MSVLQQQTPQFTIAQAEAWAATLYGLQVTAQARPSYLDQNFYVETDDGEAFLLKIANAAEDRAVLDMQQTALRYLAERHPDIPCQRVCPTTSGEWMTVVAGTDGLEHLVWMVTYLPGKLFADVKPHAPGLLRDLGTQMGRIDAALADFSHPAMHRTLVWDLKHAATLRPLLVHLKDPVQHAMVEGLLDRFETHLYPLFSHLRTSVIHNDANDYNVLVGRKGGAHRITGIIDFGDLLHTYTVCEVAIAATYAMLGKSDPLAAGAQVVAGYHDAYPLTEKELETLYDLIAARLCISVLMAAHRKQEEPDNAYLVISEQAAWDLLAYLADLSPSLAHYTFRHACGLPPCPHTQAVVDWLQAHEKALAPVVQPDPRTESVVVFDFSVGSTAWSLADLTTPMLATDALFERMERAGAKVGIGRYDEPRLIYTSDQFKAGDELRTVHIGLDFFQPAGSPVFAPLDGIVHSFQNNDLPLDYGPTIILEHDIADGLTFFTLYGHLSNASLEGLHEGQSIASGEPFATLGDEAENGGWAPHLHFQVMMDMLGRKGDFPGVAPPSERAVWLSICPDPNVLVGLPEAAFPKRGRSVEDLLARRAQVLGRNLSVAYQQPLKMVRGHGAYLYDHLGRAYLDGVNNVAHVGHSHPRVVQAAQRQMGVLNTNTRYLHDVLVDYAERLTATLPDPLSVCFFVNSGSEANDLALRMARTHTGRRDILVVDHAYHGHLTSLIDISPYKFDGQGGTGAPPHTHVVPMPDVFRGRYKGDDAGASYAGQVEEVVARTGGVAAFIAESLLSCGGQIELPAGYLQAAYRHVRATGGVCIADEVQVGFGRVGTHFWGFETQGVVPDIVTMGKPIGNGHPLAAVVTTPEIGASFANGMEYFNTFGGNPVSCAVGLAVLDVIEEEGLQAHALRVGNHLKTKLAALMADHPIIGDVRGHGLFLGVELVRSRATLEPADTEAAYIINRMRDHRMLLSTDGPLHNVIKIKPPLVFSEADADRLVQAVAAVLEEDICQM